MFVPVGTVTIAALASVVSLRAATPERLWLLVAMVASSLEVWLNVHGSVRFTLGWYLAKSGSLFASLTVLLFLLHDITLLYLEAAVSNAVLHRLVRLDALTELLNRRGFDETVAEEFRRARRQRLPLAAVLIDIDFFKPFNDRYGHQGGDDCLRQVGAAIKNALSRPGDHAARYGGEEFVILLPATDLPGAVVIAERVRVAVAALGIPHADSPLEMVTISAGVSSVIPLHAKDTAADLIETADQALYQAKKDGRNRVCAATPSPAVTSPPLTAELPSLVS
jgi:diguanylate cyclase (GGDEF)-like protein